ncbi:MAG TPA: efflux RND transporter permease subunit, partial [Gemmatimonadaceae bacterium]|nr:efflux RND transporter permease subunit [Gemmatimonadaceae bacterium]
MTAERFIAWAVRNRLTVLALVAFTAVAGVWALWTLRVEALPDLTDVQVQVLVEAPGLSPVETERLIAAPVEIAMNGLPDVTQVRSISKYGFAAVTVVFRDRVDVYFARSLVNERLQSVRELLPEQAEASLGPLAGAISEIYLYTVEGPGRDLTELRTIHDRLVRPQLQAVPGITEINSFGGFVKQVQVTIHPDRLVAYGLTLHDMVEAIEGGNAIAAGGYLEQRDEQFILRGLGQAQSAADVGRIVMRAGPAGVPVLVGDVATVGYGPELRQGAVSRDGRGEVVSGIV